ncbi:uncharacterized protein B0T15DRAFT_566211 [Chaetomium strumarium]|uniref:Uncharacterized protein n=1 Tax=Chaetomium strumarium TaxID=1170767 RepID=A0AAJ0M2J8_9PEZI|nr:hypothetical protein B0T15DRAFT_566211 [Chaetomium strumarium]
MASQLTGRGLNWLQPGRQEVAVVGSYVAGRAAELHTDFGGSSHLDVEHVKFVPEFRPYAQLEHALKEYVAQTLRNQVTTIDDDLCHRIGVMEKAYSKFNGGLWHRLWYGMGGVNVEDLVIPDDYGLSVIKAGIALVFKSAADLYQAIVKAIEDLALVLSKMEQSLRTKLATRLKRGNESQQPPPTVDAILQALREHINGYNGAVNLARDHATERTEVYSHLTAANTALVHQDTSYLRKWADEEKKRADKDATIQRKQRQKEENFRADVLRAMRGAETGLKLLAEKLMAEMQASNRTLLLEFIMESKQRKAEMAEIVALRQQLEASHISRHTVIVNLTQLCSILAQPLSAHRQMSMKSQGQVQLLLEHPQFLDWLSSSHPSLMLVDANIRESSLEGLSAISVLSSTLVTSLMQAYADTAIVVHFFCGMHAWPKDAWYGPPGLVRSLIMQLLMKLDARDPNMQTWDQDFIDDRGLLQDLEEHSLVGLCFVLHSLLYQFPVDTCIYCIVDSISWFDVRPLHNNLNTVMERFRPIVNDTKLVPVSTRAITSMPLFTEDLARLITLSRHNLVPGQISELTVGDHLLSAPVRLARRTPSPSPFRHSRRMSPVVSVRKKTSEPVLTMREVFPDRTGGGNDDFLLE